MTIPRSRKEKRTWVEETVRVMAIARAINEEIRAITRIPGTTTTMLDALAHPTGSAILEVADRIAARTED